MTWPLQPLQPLREERHNSNHLSVHQWIRSAVLDSQKLTSPIRFLFLKLRSPPCAVLWNENIHISQPYTTIRRIYAHIKRKANPIALSAPAPPFMAPLVKYFRNTMEHLWVTKIFDWLKRLKPQFVHHILPPAPRRNFLPGTGSAISYICVERSNIVLPLQGENTNAWRKQPQGLAFAQRRPKLPESEASRPESDPRKIFNTESPEWTHSWLWLNYSIGSRLC